MNKNWFLVDKQKTLQRAVDDFANSSLLSIDTEYDSFRYFREKLCLIQIKAKTASYIFDPLNGIDLYFLGKYLANPAIIKILHAADNDIRLLKEITTSFLKTFSIRTGRRICWVYSSCLWKKCLIISSTWN